MIDKGSFYIWYIYLSAKVRNLSDNDVNLDYSETKGVYYRGCVRLFL